MLNQRHIINILEVVIKSEVLPSLMLSSCIVILYVEDPRLQIFIILTIFCGHCMNEFSR